MGTDADGHGLLADAGVTRPVDQAALVRLDELLLGAAEEEHATVEGTERVEIDHGP